MTENFMSSPVGLLVIIASILLSMTLHEAMHAFAAHWLGDDTAEMEGRLSLNPLKHIDPIFTIAMPLLLAFMGAPVLGAAKPVPFNPYRVKYEEFGAAIVGLAGPLTNLSLAVAGAFLLRAVSGFLPEIGIWSLMTFIMVNLGFFVFNMIPFPPLDGSRILYAVAPEPLQKVMSMIESYGIFGFVIFFMLFFQNISPFIADIISKIFNFLV